MCLDALFVIRERCNLACNTLIGNVLHSPCIGICLGVSQKTSFNDSHSSHHLRAQQLHSRADRVRELSYCEHIATTVTGSYQSSRALTVEP